MQSLLDMAIIGWWQKSSTNMFNQSERVKATTYVFYLDILSRSMLWSCQAMQFLEIKQNIQPCQNANITNVNNSIIYILSLLLQTQKTAAAKIVK